MARGDFDRLSWPLGAGVDIFFVISGFIMVFSTRVGFGSWSAVRTFVTRRLARVLPPYYVYTLAMAAAAVLLPSQLDSAVFSWEALAKSLMFLPYANAEGAVRPLLSLGWTLNYEIAFYALFAVFLPFARGRGLTWMLCALVGIVLLGLLLKPTAVPLAFWSNPIILEFGAGALLGHLFVAKRGEQDIDVVPVGLLLVASLAAAYIDPETMVRPMTLGVAGCVLMYIFAWKVQAPAGRTGDALSLLGDSSYSLYLCHPFALAIWKLAWPFRDDRMWDWAYVVSASLFAVGCGIVSYLVIEKPLLKLFKGSSKPVPKAGVESAV